MDPRNTHEKKFRSHGTPTKKKLNTATTHEENIWSHEIPMRKTLGPTKYTREKVLSPRNTHRNKFRTHEIPTTKAFGRTKYPQTPTTPTITYDPLSFAQSSKFNLICFF